MPDDAAALRHAAEHHAFAALVRTDGWRLYMARLLADVDNLEQAKYSAEHSEHTRSLLLGRLYQIDRDIKWAYEQADEENPLKTERKALLARLAGMLYKEMPKTEEDKAPEEEPIRRRSRRAYAGGVE